MSIVSEIDICNMALQHLGNYGSVNEIRPPRTDKEKVFALWYDNERQRLIKTTMPNFAQKRQIVAKAVVPIVFGYKNAFRIPNECLKVLGVGNIDRKLENRYTVEGGFIYTHDEWNEGLPLRYVVDITDVTKMTSEFKDAFAISLAERTALPITQDLNKKQLMAQLLQPAMANLLALNAQENLPIRRSESRFRAARWGNPAMNKSKE